MISGLGEFIDACILGLLSFIFGVLICLLDRLNFYLFQRSLLRINYKEKIGKNILMILSWSVGACIVGIIGGVLGVFNLDGMISASLAIAIGWPLIAKDILSQGVKKPAPDGAG